MEKEVWKDIPNYQGYQVSNLGRVRTYNKITRNKLYEERHWKNRILKPIKNASKKSSTKPSYTVCLWKNNKPKKYLIHRLVAFTFYNKDINENLTVDHIDGNRNNNKLDNLEIVSLKENIQRGFKNKLYTMQKPIEIIEIETNNRYIFNSMSLASQFIGKNKGYISDKVKKDIFYNKKYKWNIIN